MGDCVKRQKHNWCVSTWIIFFCFWAELPVTGCRRFIFRGGGRFAKRRMNTVGPKSLRAHFATRKGRVETWASQPDVQQLQWQMPQHGTRHTNPNPIVLSTHSLYIGSPNLGGRWNAVHARCDDEHQRGKKSLPNIEKSAFFAIKVPPNPLNHMQIYRVSITQRVEIHIKSPCNGYQWARGRDVGSERVSS